MTKKERFNVAYNFLYENGFIHNQKDAAAKMGTTAPNMSSARNGVETVLTDSFLKRFADAFPAISEEWLLTENGEMLTLANNTGKPASELDKLKEENAALRKEVERLRKENDSLRSEMVGMERLARALGLPIASSQIEEKKNVV